MTYDVNGNLAHPGPLEVDEDEFRFHFVDEYPESETRSSIFQGFKEYQSTLLNSVMSNIEQWIDGSWVSNKRDPQDIDIVSLIGLDFFYPIDFVTNKLLTNVGSKDEYAVDAYVIIVCPKDDPRYDDVTKKWMEYWDKQWSHDRQENKKGYIVLKTNYYGVRNE